MNRIVHNRMAKSAALAAALLLAMAPVDLLAFCGCNLCGCAGAAEDAPGCCCTGKSHASSCCDQSAAEVSTEGCACSKSVPVLPAGTLPASSHDNLQPLAIQLAFTPPVADIAPALFLTSARDQPLWPIPARVLFCVWRN
jgi:hypothetical protein